MSKCKICGKEENIMGLPPFCEKHMELECDSGDGGEARYEADYADAGDNDFRNALNPVLQGNIGYITATEASMYIKQGQEQFRKRLLNRLIGDLFSPIWSENETCNATYGHIESMIRRWIEKIK
jgi:hypothetical protein